jgi:hypothetical protein
MGRKEQALVTLTQAITRLRETRFSEPLKVLTFFLFLTGIAAIDPEACPKGKAT